MNIEQAKTIPIELVLRAIGASEPIRTAKNGKDIWFRSPLREGDSEASFVAHPQRGTWKDFGTGLGGDVIALAQAHLNGASVFEALRWLEHLIGAGDGISFDELARTTSPDIEPFVPGPAGFELVETRVLSYPPILAYINGRGIALETVQRFCSEVYYQRKGKPRERPYFGIGFPTNAPDSWEVRGLNAEFKTVIGQKEITTLYSHEEQEPHTLHVFEGFFDFLTFEETHGLRSGEAALVLNSAYLDQRGIAHIKSEQRLQGIERVLTWFDSDRTGQEITARFASAFGDRIYGDMSPHYLDDHKDLNAAYVAAKRDGRRPSWQMREMNAPRGVTHLRL